MMEPGIRPGETPPFHRLGEYVFEELCRDLFDAEPSIATCDIYGTRGQSQDGIDLLAYRIGGEGIEVGQCKCYEVFTAADVRKASDKFFKHWERWKGEDVRRFILFVSCDLRERRVQEEILEQKKRFREYGIEFEPWSAPKILNKLRPHSGIVAAYFSPADHWVSAICGVSSPAPSTQIAESRTSVAISGVLVSQLERIAVRESVEVQQRLERMRSAWREGERSEVIRWLKDLKGDDAIWPILSPDVRVKLLRFEAGLELDLTGDISRAKQLADEARSLAPADSDIRLQAMIAYKETGPEAAVELLAKETEIDSLNFRAALLLDMRRIEECREILDVENSSIEPNAETFRVRALSCLAGKDMSQARLEIKKAQELEPRWETVRFAAAVIDYFSSLSPAALPDGLVTWPEPVDWIMVKRDDEGLLRRREAAKVFRQLNESHKEDKEKRHMFEGWLIACMANDPDAQEEAIDYCRSVLLADPANYRVIVWALARRFGIDLEGSIEAIERLVTDGSATIPDILTLVSCYLSSDEPSKALKLLEDTRASFQDYHADSLWVLWRVQSLVASGETEAAVSAVDSPTLDTELRHAKTMALRALASKTNDWEEVVQHLETGYAETGEPGFLLQLCEIKAYRKEWVYVASQAEHLVEAVATGDALRLAAIGAYNAGHYELCLHLLDSRRTLFQDEKLPSDLRSMRVLCQKALGILPKAVEEAEALAHDEPTTANLLNLAELYSEKGDMKGLAIAARKLSTQTDLSSEEALRVAHLVILEDRQLATSLWRRANKQGVSDDLVGKAFMLGNQLGLETEVSPLMARMADLAHEGRGGIQVVPIEDLIAFAKKHRDRMVELDDAYAKGAVPFHVIAEQLNRPLVDYYHDLLAQNELAPDPLGQSILLARHGGRDLLPGFPKNPPTWRLNLDVTALLLAEHLEILDYLEKAFAPLRIPADTIPALVRMREKTAHPQPSRVQACRQIVELIDRGSLTVVDPPTTDSADTQLVEELGGDRAALLEMALTTGGCVVDFLPLRKRDLSGRATALPEAYLQHIVNCRAIVEGLREHGPFSEEEYVGALRALGSEGQRTDSKVVPIPGSSLYCYGNMVEVLAGAKLLSVVCERFRVFIEAREVERVRGEIRGYERRSESIAWLDGLLNRLTLGIDSGTYQVIPRAHAKDEASEEAMDRNPDIGCIEALLQFEAQQGDVVWADDRYLTSYLQRVGAPIVGVNEILKALVSAGVLDRSDYYRKLERLRAANVRFIPVQKDEILYHLEQATVREGMVVETTGLRTLRRYVAACMSRLDLLQWPPLSSGTPNERGEVPFVLGLSRAVTDALASVWASGDQVELCKARAEWLLSSIYLDYLGLVKIARLQGSEEDGLYMTAISLASLISNAFALEASRKTGETSIRQGYLNWLSIRILRKKFDADPNLIGAVSDALKKILLSARDSSPVKVPVSAATELIQAFFEDLPERIRAELHRDADFMAHVGLSALSVVTVDDLVFDPDEFWQAAADVINGRRGVISPIESEKELILQKHDLRSDRLAFSFNHPKDGNLKIVADDDLGLLLDSPSEREAILRQNRRWFDSSDDNFEQAIADISSTEVPRKRLEETREWRKSSAAVYYDDLLKKVSARVRLRISDLLPPSAEGLLRHFRLPSNVRPSPIFQEALGKAGQALIREEGLLEAINRLSGLPVPLPPVIFEAVADLSPEARRTLIRQLLMTACSPTAKIHLIHILIRSINDSPAYSRLVQWIITRLLSPKGTEEVEAFFAVLKWTNAEFVPWPDTKNWSPQARLAMVWAHAHRLFAILVSAGVQIAWVLETFNAARNRIAVEIFERNEEYWLDVTHPRQAGREAFLLAGISYALGEKAGEIVDHKLEELFATWAFLESGGIRLPVLPLLKNSSRLRNGMESFLGGDRCNALSPLVGVESAAVFAESSLRQLAEYAGSTLANGKGGVPEWGLLRETLGDAVPYEDMVDRLKAIMARTDFVELVKQDLAAGLMATNTATLLAVNLSDDELRSRLKDQLVSVVRYFSTQNADHVGSDSENDNHLVEPNQAALILLESALNIAMAIRRSPDEVIVEFREVVTRIVDTWRPISLTCRNLVQRLCDDLPISQAQRLWPLLVKLRAE